MSDHTQPSSGIELETSFFVLAFILHFFTPKVVIDGYDPGKVPWGRVFIPVAPGRHQVRVFFPYLFISGGDVTDLVDVHEGHVTSVRYKAPTWFVFLAGKLTVLETYPMGSRPFAPVPPVWAGQFGQVQGQPAPTAQPAQAAQPVAATTETAAGWHSDPMGRYEQRYWDGTAWTAHVTSQGVQATDEVG